MCIRRMRRQLRLRAGGARRRHRRRRIAAINGRGASLFAPMAAAGCVPLCSLFTASQAALMQPAFALAPCARPLSRNLLLAASRRTQFFPNGPSPVPFPALAAGTFFPRPRRALHTRGLGPSPGPPLTHRPPMFLVGTSHALLARSARGPAPRARARRGPLVLSKPPRPLFDPTGPPQNTHTLARPLPANPTLTNGIQMVFKAPWRAAAAAPAAAAPDPGPLRAAQRRSHPLVRAPRAHNPSP